jgi:hypothetical protein
MGIGIRVAWIGLKIQGSLRGARPPRLSPRFSLPPPPPPPTPVIEKQFLSQRRRFLLLKGSRASSSWAVRFPDSITDHSESAEADRYRSEFRGFAIRSQSGMPWPAASNEGREIWCHHPSEGETSVRSGERL